MPQTPDRFPGVRNDEGIDLDDTALPTQPGQIRYIDGVFWFQDSVHQYPLIPPNAYLYNNQGGIMVDNANAFMFAGAPPGP